MQKPTIFVTRRWPKETVEGMKKFFEVTINQDDRPLTQSEIADGFESHDALAPTVSDNIDPVSYTHLTLPTTPYV